MAVRGKAILNRHLRLLGCLLSVGFTQASVVRAEVSSPLPAEIRTCLQRSADWQLANPSGVELRDWEMAPFYDGLLRVATTTGDARYLAAVLRFGTQSGWMPGNRTYNANNLAVGHAWLDVYLMDRRQKERFKPIRDRLDFVIAHPITEAVVFGRMPRTPGVAPTDRWTWCDALYMAPPTLAGLYAATGDEKYLGFLNHEYRYTYNQLYDPTEHLFFRDPSYIHKRTSAGEKVFWGRGNGWVYAGLALVLEQIPADNPARGFYENLFKEMTGAILAAQQPDGLWRPSLLDPEQVPMGETSGSGFFVFGLAWGVNHGLLDRAKVWPAIVRGWAGLVSCTRPDGYVGYVQPIGASPAPLTADSTQVYGTGAFLLAGSEVLRAVGGAAKTEPAALLSAAERVLASEAKTPRAYARLVPERKDDLAWENDKVAFRVYGPALRSSVEDSGIDVWFKRVPYPIIDKWYRDDLAGKGSYHQDHGEGYDGYKVGATRGCGGLGLWIDGHLVTANTYLNAGILWTSPDVAEFKTVYRYPVKFQGKTLYEYRLTRLHLGDRLFEVTSFFSTDPDRRPKPIRNFPDEIAIGLVTQHKGASITRDPAAGIASVYETVDRIRLGTGIVIAPPGVLRMRLLPDARQPKTREQLLVFTRVDSRGTVTYRAGYAWAGDGQITTEQEWLAYLEAQASQPLPREYQP